MGIHDGHRARLKSRFHEHGPESFDDINLLELLLFYALPRQDTNVIAHALLDRFGSLDAVLEASAEELESVSGIGENAAILLRLIPAVSRRYLIVKTPDNETLGSITAAARYLLPRFLFEREEVALALLLDARNRPICCREMGRGVVNAVEINARRLVSLVLERKASSVILSHNHLSGVALPSAEDESATRCLRDALSLVGVKLIDHIVFAGNDYVSMKEAGMLR